VSTLYQSPQCRILEYFTLNSTTVMVSSFAFSVNYSVLRQFSVASINQLTLCWKSQNCRWVFTNDGIRHCSRTDLTLFLVYWTNVSQMISCSLATWNSHIFSQWNDTCWIALRFSPLHINIFCVVTWSQRYNCAYLFVNKQLWIHKLLLYILERSIRKATYKIFSPFT
jgi:hypothetical protein